MPLQKHTKFIFVTGGVISGLGKGITVASTSLLLKNLGLNVSVLKADMYLNLDAGTMNPLEHGEVFVTEDGLETDQDLGHYERFLNQNLYRHNYLTMGKVYYDVLTKERRLEYKGKCVEGHIHIPQEIINTIEATAKKDNADVLIVEVGGTVGEYQNVLFYEAIRRLKQKRPKDVFLVHVVYLLVPTFLGEMKSKPAQASIYELYKLGLQPDFIIGRSSVDIDDKRKETMSFNTGVKKQNIIAAPDADTIYKVPLILKKQKFDKLLLKEIELRAKKLPDDSWEKFIAKVDNVKKPIKIAIAGKYFTSGNFSLEDAYVCVIEAIKHAAWFNNVKPEICWFDVENINGLKELKHVDGIIVPQGWGSRGVEGKLKVVEFARTHNIPYLGLCFGMQMAVIEYARNVLKLKKANSEEVDPQTPYPVIHIMPNQKEYLAKNQFGGTIRLGAWPCLVKLGSALEQAYSEHAPERINKLTIMERHRHRYEVNNAFREQLEASGLIISGTSPDGRLVEAVELSRKEHPFFVGTQFHPEYKSSPLHPHPLFIEFVKTCALTKVNLKLPKLMTVPSRLKRKSD